MPQAKFGLGSLLIGCLFLGISGVAKSDWLLNSENDFIFENAKSENSVVNPSNRVVQLPDAAGTVDLRPQLNWRGDTTTIMLRPRFVGEASTWLESDPNQRESKSLGRWNLTDAYVRQSLGERSQINAGLEVYQWGPAEFYNASNPFFHLFTNEHSAFFKEKGQALLRWTFDVSSSVSHMLIIEPVNNAEPSFRAEQSFHASGALKSEWRADSGNDYLGFLVGSNPDQDLVAGLYGNYANEQGWSVYLDGKINSHDRSFQPISENGSVLLAQSQLDRASGIELVGLRFEGAQDWRIEYLYNSSGYSHQDLLRILNSFQTLNIFTGNNLGTFSRPGLELLGKQYLYVSVRIPNLGARKESTLFFREALNLLDTSGLFQINFESPLSDSLILELETAIYTGSKTSEFTLLDQYSLTFGIKWLL